jgi:hypothetical protein
MKYVSVIPDGCADEPVVELGRGELAGGTLELHPKLKAAFAVALLVCLGFPSSVSANAREDPAARRAKTAAWKADEDTRLFVRVICAGVGGTAVWVAVGIARNGFGLGTRLRRITGPPAWTIAAVIGALGLAIAVVGILYVSVLLSWL